MLPYIIIKYDTFIYITIFNIISFYILYDTLYIKPTLF